MCGDFENGKYGIGRKKAGFFGKSARLCGLWGVGLRRGGFEKAARTGHGFACSDSRSEEYEHVAMGV